MNVAVAPLCACESGLRSIRCCGMERMLPAATEAAKHLAPLIQQAAQAHKAGSVEAAERLCLDVLELAPDRPGALTILYEIRKKQGRSRATEALVRRIVALDPNNLWATNELGLILLGTGRLSEAQTHARNGVRIAPENAQAHNLLGMVLTEEQRPQIGEYHYRRVLELLKTRDPIVLANLAWNLKAQGRMAEARSLYEESVKTAPNVPQTLLGWARLEEADRNFAAADQKLDMLEAINPLDPAVKLTRATVLARKRQYVEALAMLESVGGTTGELSANDMLEKGRLLDQLGRYDEAFEAFTQAKRLLRERTEMAYQEPQANELVSRLRGFFTAGRLRITPRAGVRTDVPQPLFILGFPRSGTTLVEQTLTAHKQIAAGDELPLIHDITAIMPRMLNSPLGYPEALAELWMGDQREGLDNLRDYYLQKVAQMGILTETATMFTDKMPLNETHLGLISLLFPASPMIHVLRHPLDIMVSAISNLFTHGMFCSYALETAAKHYVLVADLIQHYRSEMALRYLPIRYEDIVDDQEASTRAMLDFVGVPFDPACLSFHENKRYARTASYAQVTQKLYASSRFRHRHYIKHLQPIIPILAPAIERLGYTVDL